MTLAVLAALACGKVDRRPDGAVADAMSRDTAPPITDSELAGDQRTSSDVGADDSAACPMECLRAVICCHSDCTGPAVNRGCCACHADEVDSVSCSPARTCAP